MGLEVHIKKNMGSFGLDVEFHIESETLSLLGASGSGKSMTLKCIAGIETPDEGKIVLDDQILFDSDKGINLSPQQRRVGYLFQNYALFPNMTVEENISAGIRSSKKEKMRVVKEKIRAFYLEGLEKKKPNHLSGGQQQRVALARMLVSEPKVIMLDEPFSALDSYLKWELEQEILNMIQRYKRPTLFVSHNRDEVYRLSDQVGLINQGKLELMSEKETLFQNPQMLTGAILTGCKNFSRIKRLENSKVFAIDWEVELTTKIPVADNINYIGIRAHHIQVTDVKDTAENNLLCYVVQTIENTFTTMIILKNVRNDRTRKEEFEPYTKICLEMDKMEWKKISDTQVRLKFLPKDLILLQ